MNFEKVEKKVVAIQEAYREGKAGIEKAIQEENLDSLTKSMNILKEKNLATPELSKEALGEFFEKIAEENPHLLIEEAPTDFEVWYEDKRIVKVSQWGYDVSRPNLEPPTDTLEDMQRELAIRKVKLDKLNKGIVFYEALDENPEVLKEVAFRKEHEMITDDSSLMERMKDWYDSRSVYRQLKKGVKGFVEHHLHELNRQQRYASKEYDKLKDRINRLDELELERVRTKEVVDTLFAQYKFPEHRVMSMQRRGDKEDMDW